MASDPSDKHNDAGKSNPIPIARLTISGVGSPGTPRSSLVDSMRGISASPRAQPSSVSSAQAVQNLIDHPPVALHSHTKIDFAGRDWKDVQLHEIVTADQVPVVHANTSIEDATKALMDSSAKLVLVRNDKTLTEVVNVFDYDHVNAYLCFVTGISQPASITDTERDEILQCVQRHEPVHLDQLQHVFGERAGPSFLNHTDTLSQAMEMLGSGVHRVIVKKAGTSEICGVLTQLQLVELFWEHVRSADAINAKTLRNLGIGETSVIAINGEQPVRDALAIIHDRGISSLPVVDNAKNVIGNISHVDVKHLTSTASLPLLDSPCIHFVNVILSERGLMDGKDSYPVYHVTPQSTLAHTVAKLVATSSHRMWIVDNASPATSMPPSPSLPSQRRPSHDMSTEFVPGQAHAFGSSVAAAGSPSASGKLSGVISLTDILNLYARVCGLHPSDPEVTRRRRRTSSSTSSVARGSMDSLRSSVEHRTSLDALRGSLDLKRKPSQSTPR